MHYIVALHLGSRAEEGGGDLDKKLRLILTSILAADKNKTYYFVLCDKIHGFDFFTMTVADILSK